MIGKKSVHLIKFFLQYNFEVLDDDKITFNELTCNFSAACTQVQDSQDSQNTLEPREKRKGDLGAESKFSGVKLMCEIGSKQHSVQQLTSP